MANKTEESGPEGPIPVALITGFLGAGKSTLIRHILTKNEDMRIAVILNEYGESVEGSFWEDTERMKAMSGDWVELDNGCLCCSVKKDFVKALENLINKERRPEYIIVETTGLANPGAAAALFWANETLESKVQLDSIITVVDALNVDRQLHEPRPDGVLNEIQLQIAYADLILLNKMDLCSEEAVKRAEADVRAINSGVHMLRSKFSMIELDLLLNRHGYQQGAQVALPAIAEGAEEVPFTQMKDDLTPRTRRSKSRRASIGSLSASSQTHFPLPSRPKQGSTDSRRSSESEEKLSTRTPEKIFVHDWKIQTTTLVTEKPLDLEKLKAFLDRVLWDRETHPGEIYRVKGVVEVKGDNRKHMVQAVYELYYVTPGAVWPVNEKTVSKLVIIGRDLNREALEVWFGLAKAD